MVIRNVSKVYRGGVKALDGVSLSVGKGMFGLLGPNGAGKSTLLRLVATLDTPTAGQVTVGGLDCRKHPGEVRRRLGYLPQAFAAFRRLTALEFLDYVGLLKGLDNPRRGREIGELVEQVGLARAARARIGTFSGGMLQRLGIAQALLGSPPLLIVDEPTAGLDPEERVRFRNLLADLGQDRTVVLSTHIVADVERACGDLALLFEGRVAFQGPPLTLAERASGRVWEVATDREGYERVRLSHQVVASRAAADGGFLLRVVGDKTPPGEVRAATPTVEDGYLATIRSAAVDCVSKAAAF
ncbi:MAG: ABC transporter ATP-binding protein [bacterium]|nr:ABC transporter ATP-binding protein [bacterium]